MNFAPFERAQLAAFAYAEARFTGSLDCMKAVCYVVRNRVKAGWGDGTWLSVIEGAHLVAGNVPVHQDKRLPIASGDRLLQLLLRDVDDIYLGGGGHGVDDDTARVVQGESKTGALYYSFIGQDTPAWFIEHIVRDPAHHARIAQVGTMLLFE